MERSELGSARLLAAFLAIGPFLLLAVGVAFPSTPSGSPLVVPAGVAGLVAPAIAWRVQARVRERAHGGRAYLRSVMLGLAVTEVAAMLGVAVWLLCRQIPALIGLPMHVLLVGALWPTEERMRQAEEDASR